MNNRLPTLRENPKAARHARDDLRALVLSAEFDELNQQSLADSRARPHGALELLRADGEHEIRASLKDEQRQRVEDIRRPVRRP